ncbi:hypothetical protein DFH08DRAFT_627914, partial [Mycena albidolilacea]
MGCVAWIANDQGIESNVYIDDMFSVDVDDDIDFYEPYGGLYPTAQVKTLRLWDEINLPHESDKQLWGRSLTVIGFEVDPNAMTFTMPEDKLRVELLAGVREFCRVMGRRHQLHTFMSLAGWLNWAFNVYPLLKPALSRVYGKIEGKENPHTGISVSQGIINDLNWFSRHVENSSGIHLLEARDW